MNNNINKSSSPTQQQPTAMSLSLSNNSTPPPPSSTQQQQPTLKDRIIQSKREINDNAPTFNISNNTTDNNNPVSLQREGGSNNKMDEGGNDNSRVSTNPTNTTTTVRRRTSVLEAASTLASLFSTTGALPTSSNSPSFEQTNKSINNKVNLKAPSSATATYRKPSALAAPSLTHNYTTNNNNHSILGTQQGRVEGGWDNSDYEQIGQTKIRVLDAPHTVTGVYGNRNSLLNNLTAASRSGGNSYEELNKHLGELNKQLGEYANNYNHRGELMNNYGGSGSLTRHQGGSGNNLLSENSLMGVEGMARVRGGRDVLTGQIRPPPSLNGNQQIQHQSLVGAARGGGGMGYNMERDDKEEEEVMDEEGNIINAPPGNDVPLTFPQKLMEVLSHPQVNDTIAWLPHGRGFIILQKRKFSLEVMPNYFKHSKFTSFTRKLNRWGFTRVSRGPEMGAYYHKLFQRGNYYMCTQMTCNSSNKSAAAAKKEGEEAADGTKTKKKKRKSGPTAQSRVYAPMSQPPPKAPPPMIELLDDDDMNVNGQRSSGVDSDDSRMSSHRMTSSLPFAGSHHQSMNGRGGDLSTASRNDFISRQQELDRLQRYMNQRNASSSGFDRAFSRHQAAMNHQHQSTNPQFSVSNLHNRRSPPMMQQSTGMSQSSSSSMQNRLRELEMMQHQLHQANQGRSNNESMSAKHLNLGAANSSSSRHHPEVIAHAMNALKSRNNQALLASLMTTNEHTKAAADKDMVQAAALQAQPSLHRQFQEYKNNQDDRNMSLPSSAINYHRSGDNSQGKDYATILNQMKQIERLNQQTRPSSDMSSRMMSSAAGNDSREIKISSLINQMTQSEVANLYREISARQQQRRQYQQQQQSSGGETLTGGETSQSSTIHAPSGEYSRSVRRASAA